MPRDLTALTAQFESSNDEEKTNLFKEVLKETIGDILCGVFTFPYINIRDTLEIFSSIDRTSPAITQIANEISTDLRNIQHNYNAIYSAQMEPINELLNFLILSQDIEQEFEMGDNTSTYSSDSDSDSDNKKEPEEKSYSTSEPIAIPPSTQYVIPEQQNSTTISSSHTPDMFGSLMALSAGHEALYRENKISGSPVAKRKSPEASGFNGGMAYSYKDLKHHKSPFDDYDSDGGVM
jgi:hypothetical protein